MLWHPKVDSDSSCRYLHLVNYCFSQWMLRVQILSSFERSWPLVLIFCCFIHLSYFGDMFWWKQKVGIEEKIILYSAISYTCHTLNIYWWKRKVDIVRKDYWESILYSAISYTCQTLNIFWWKSKVGIVRKDYWESISYSATSYTCQTSNIFGGKEKLLL